MTDGKTLTKVAEIKPLGLFIVREHCEIGHGTHVTVYAAMDNTTGDAWCEDFFTYGAAAKWLVGEYMEAELAHEQDLKFLEKELRERTDDPGVLADWMEFARGRSL